MAQIIKVICYSGYRAAEMPRAFILHDEEIRITEVLDMWIDEGLNHRIRRRFFKVRGSDGLIHEIYMDEETDVWYISEK